MQISEEDGEEREFVSSDGAWLNRKGPFCFSAPLYPFCVHFPHFMASSLFTTSLC